MNLLLISCTKINIVAVSHFKIKPIKQFHKNVQISTSAPSYWMKNSSKCIQIFFFLFLGLTMNGFYVSALIAT